jgi:hypothetical protein
VLTHWSYYLLRLAIDAWIVNYFYTSFLFYDCYNTVLTCFGFWFWIAWRLACHRQREVSRECAQLIVDDRNSQEDISGLFPRRRWTVCFFYVFPMFYSNT